MFEPIHGSAFDIAGKGIGNKLPLSQFEVIANITSANPVATFWTACEMLAWIGQKEAADYLLKVIEDVCEKGIMTPDLGGTATTIEVTNAVCAEIELQLGKMKTEHFPSPI